MHLDIHFKEISLLFLMLMLTALVSKKIRLPNAVGFLLAGVLFGPNVLSLVSDEMIISKLGSIGVVLLLFFTGMHISPQKIVKNWKVSIVGTVLQIVITTLIVVLVGKFWGWRIERSVLLGFVISLSSTAMVVNYLKDLKMEKTTTGEDCVSILISQDILIVPMMIVITAMGSTGISFQSVVLQIIGTVILTCIIHLSIKHKERIVRHLKVLEADSEIQTLFCLSFAFGLAMVSGYLELSTALGAFIAGGIISQLKIDNWFYSSLESFRIVFVALFFASVGMIIDVKFLKVNILQSMTLVILALILNTLINAAVLKIAGRSWKEGIYSGALLSQLGEFGFILAAIGLQAGTITSYGYKMTILVIALSIVFTPFWVWFSDRIRQKI